VSRNRTWRWLRCSTASCARTLASTTLLVVSDHGMTEAQRTADLRALTDAGLDAAVIGGGGFAQLEVRGDADRAARIARAVEIARGLGLEAWPNGQGPPEYAITNARFGDVVVVAPRGTAIAAQSRIYWLLGIAGIDRFAMRGIPDIGPVARDVGALRRDRQGVAAGARPGTVRAVDVAPTVLALLGLPIPDGWKAAPSLSTLESNDDRKTCFALDRRCNRRLRARRRCYREEGGEFRRQEGCAGREGARLLVRTQPRPERGRNHRVGLLGEGSQAARRDDRGRDADRDLRLG
jgi:hypothetical protein